MRTRTLLIVALACCAAVPAAAQSWQVTEEEDMTLSYRDAKDEKSLIEVMCEAKGSRIVVPVDPGTKAAGPAKLELALPKGAETIQLPADVCARGECTDRANGEVSAYLIARKGKDLALRAATATQVRVSAAGISVDAPADKAVFDRFAALCRKHR